MSKHSLVVVGPDGRRPFMRGIVVQSLVTRGVPFDVALETATLIRDELQGRGEVGEDELAKLVEGHLQDQFDLEALPRRPVLEPPLVKGPRGSGNPFSKGILAVSLQGAGLDPSDAYDVARELEAHLLRQGQTEIDRAALRDLVCNTIEERHGARAAQRYRVWRQSLEDGRPVFILLGGSTGVGKTSIAVEVARRLEISRVIGTDSIRQIMRLMFSADLMPEIHCSTYDAHQMLRAHRGLSGDPVIEGFREQAQRITVGVQALLDRAVEENTSLLIEGVNLLPSMVDLARYEDHAHVISLVVASLDTEAFRKRFGQRAAESRERPADRYLQHMDEIVAIQDHILAEADQGDLAIIDNVRFDEAVLSVIRSVISTLKKSFPQDVESSGR